MKDMQLLADIRKMSTEIRYGNADSGTHYLLGYVWTTLTEEQQNEIAKSFREQLSILENAKEMIKR
jgi:ABC-type transporter MlaC component